MKMYFKPRLFIFFEAVVDKTDQGMHGLLLVGPFGLYGKVCAFARSEKHERHDAFTIDSFSVQDEPNITAKILCSIGKFGCRARVQTEFVDNFRFLFQHLA